MEPERLGVVGRFFGKFPNVHVALLRSTTADKQQTVNSYQIH